MALQFCHPGDKQTFYHSTISRSDLAVTDLTETRELVHIGEAEMNFTNWCFDGYRLASNTLQQHDTTSFGISNTIDAVKLYFNRRGRTSLHYRQLGNKFSIGSGQCNMLYSSELNTLSTHFDTWTDMFSLQLTNAGFQELISGLSGELKVSRTGNPGLKAFLDRIQTGDPALLFTESWMNMNPAMERCIAEILDCPYQGQLKRLYLRTKAAELFIHFAAGTFMASQNPALDQPSSGDRERLYFVKQYLESNYADSLTLSDISRLAGLNEFKLKKGFKALFHSSVIDYLIDCRLNRARTLILDTEKSLAEIAFETGYASPGYFSKAFKSKYGINAASLRQR